MSAYANLRKYHHYEVENRRQSFVKCKGAIKNYERGFNLCSKTISDIFTKANTTLPIPSKRAARLIAFRLMGTMQSIRDLTLMASYYESLILQRSFLESIGLIAYLSENEEEATLWTQNKKISVSTFKLIENISKFLQIDGGKQGPYLVKFYGELCNYAHSNMLAVFSLFLLDEKEEIEIDGTKIVSLPIRLPSAFNEQLVIDITFLPMILLLTIGKVFGADISKTRKLEIEKLLETIRETRN